MVPLVVQLCDIQNRLIALAISTMQEDGTARKLTEIQELRVLGHVYIFKVERSNKKMK